MNTTARADDGAAVSLEAARDLLVDLVSIPSPSGEEDAAAERLAAFFEAHDREVWLDAVGNVRAPADNAVLLTSHVDTVPGEIPVRVETAAEGDAVAAAGEDVLWGRGSVDATGPLAAMAAAAVRTGTSFVGVVGEETSSRGARHLVTDRDEPGAVINGEPSGADGITLGYRGIVSGTYTAESDSGHTSRPEPNAIQDAMSWWSRVEAAVEPDGGSDADTPVFERVTAKPVSVTGGTTADGLAVRATVDFQCRVPPSLEPADVRETVEAECGGSGCGLEGEGYGLESEGHGLEWTDEVQPVMQSPRTDVARAFRVAIRAEGGEPRLLRKTGTSDMNVYAGAWECPMATYGPGDSDLDHAPDERLSLAEFDRSVAVLERVARSLSEATQ
ncbi:[LysW]-lysine hydrolase [Natrononativus amylolyticus]|uniref:[LysW]-lysine hydrolase n=1 Tax=Natrononativus amylolyticus TaxID=2963434 RepID=UPI0020CDA2FD|nr:[LysW]-lysine hydrolase [Natrononativus amylolyticus]